MKAVSDYIPSVAELQIPENIWETEAGKEILDTENNFLEIVNLQPASGYFLRIFANNDVGTSKPSPTIAIQTKEEGIMKNSITLIPISIFRKKIK